MTMNASGSKTLLRRFSNASTSVRTLSMIMVSSYTWTTSAEKRLHEFDNREWEHTATK